MSSALQGHSIDAPERIATETIIKMLPISVRTVVGDRTRAKLIKYLAPVAHRLVAKEEVQREPVAP